MLAVADTPNDGAADTVAELHRTGLQVAMVTGDNSRPAQAIAQQSVIDTVPAEVLPATNRERRLQKTGNGSAETAGLADPVDRGARPYRWTDVDDWTVAAITDLFARPSERAFLPPLAA
ncbi:HAD family hydrolase [Pseudonocardia sp. CA-142604]|uniref:HAD family hydrolase n=1 Tax=Pseudonocardia sp. CA-142604 TaxID=3240024 RepID=UPI003D89EFDE